MDRNDLFTVENSYACRKESDQNAGAIPTVGLILLTKNKPEIFRS